jgi:short-subunit dehydrogenase
MIDRPLADHAIVITGASSGIGAAVAMQLAAQGAWLVLTARRAHELDEVAQQCIALGGRAVLLAGDVTDAAHCQHVVEKSIAAYGKLDVLINNAGLGGHFAVQEAADLAVYERIMRVNYLGSVFCTHFALPHLIASRGRLVAISSLAGKTGVPMRAAYAASKHAMHGFFDSLRIELAATGVTVTMVCPGYVQTSFRVQALGPDGAPRGTSHVREGEVMTVDECADLTVRAIVARRRELVMTLRGKLGSLVKPLLPTVIDAVAARAVRDGK